MTRTRLRNLGITIGRLSPGPHNAITDVPGIAVGHTTLIRDTPRVARTGVTVIVPRDGQIWEDAVFGAFHSFNGNGEMTGLPWLVESGLIDAPIAITNTHQVGRVRDALVAHAARMGYLHTFMLPIVAETYDGFLNDIDAFHLTETHVEEALAAAQTGPVPEGNVGGGTGMICHGFKGGIGTASRLVDYDDQQFVVGVLVQANYGGRHELRVDGVPVGQELGPDVVPLPGPRPAGSSIIVIVATDAPLLPGQCRRLAQRATVGLARVGGLGHNSSGDIFLAFATGNHLAKSEKGGYTIRMLPQQRLDPFFVATTEAVEESILNALTAAETMTGYQGRTVHALPLDRLQTMMARYRPAS